MTLSTSDLVHTVEDFFDRPISGYADYQGVPHAYEATFNHASQEYDGQFLLRPASAEEFAATVELWAIWLRWEAAFHSGRAGLDSHPCLPADKPRHKILSAERQRMIEASDAPTLKARGRMFLDDTKAWRVVWTPAS